MKRTLKRDYWIKSRNKPLGRNINSETQEFQRQLFQIVFRIGVPGNSAIFTGKHLCCCVGVSFYKITGLQTCSSIKKRLQHICFPVNIEKFFKNIFFYRAALVAASGIERFIFLFPTYATLKIYEDTMTQKNLMISSWAGSSLPGKYSYEIPHGYLSGRANLSGKVISIKHNYQSSLGFFSNSNFPSRISSDFFRTALFLEKLLLHTFSE